MPAGGASSVIAFPPSTGWNYLKSDAAEVVTLTDSEMSASNIPQALGYVNFYPTITPDSSPRTIYVTASSPGMVGLNIYVNGAVAASQTLNNNTATLSVTLPAGSTSFYIQIQNAWAASVGLTHRITSVSQAY